MNLSRWNYGNAYRRHPIEEGSVVIYKDGSALKVHDIFKPLPDFMFGADILFIDPPWNLGNLNCFYTKAEQMERHNSFESFYKRLFKCISEIGARTAYVEVGKEYLAEFILEMKGLYKHVIFYNTMYYHKKTNFCYVVRGSAKRQKTPLDGLDEEDVIKWVCAYEDYSCIGDLCMGRGLVAINAHKNGQRFVGTELNHKRLSVVLERLPDYHILEAPTESA